VTARAAAAGHAPGSAAGGVIRRLGRSDHDRLLRHFLRLGAEDRQLRFGGYVTDASVRAYCARLDPQRTLVLGWFVAGELGGVGELKPIGGSWPRAAELAVSVEAAFRGRGVGTELCRRLAVRARNRLVAHVHMLCLLDNRPVQQIARKLGSTLTFHQGEVEAWLRAPRPDPLSAFEEWLDEADALLDLGAAHSAGSRSWWSAPTPPLPRIGVEHADG
jgi:ribosomal protein S18 acetylase RimI-like enzyme